MENNIINADFLSGILDNLSEEDINNLSAFAESLGESGKGEQNENFGEAQDDSGGFSIDPEMLFKIMNLFSRLNSNRNDPRCNLIAALKPLLSPKRQKKADTAIELMRVFSILSFGDIFGSE